MNEELIKDLCDFPENKIAKEANLIPEKIPILWQSLLDSLWRKEKLPNDAMPLLDQHRKYSSDDSDNDIKNGSLLDYIQNLIDLYPSDNDAAATGVSNFYKQIKNNILNNSSNIFWNESLHYAIKNFLNYLDDDAVLIEIPKNKGTHSILFSAIKAANAGWDFLNTAYEEVVNEKKWVNPYWNINNKSYYEVRKQDQIRQILSNSKKLQGTRSQENEKWIRLLMPQYGRRVEIEDLDRNFWVIQEVIASIGKYLFEDENSIQDILKNILKEITELWENVLYLWASDAMITQKTNDDVRVIVMPIPAKGYRNNNRQQKAFNDNKISRTDIRFDDFANDMEVTISDDSFSYTLFSLEDNGDSANEIKTKVFNRIKYLAEIYSDQNLCIIPYFRAYNYKHNYYAGEFYRHVFTYTRMDEKSDSSLIENWDIWDLTESINNNIFNGIMISPFRKLDRGGYFQNGALMSINQDTDSSINIRYPFDNISLNNTDNEIKLSDYYYSAIRTAVIPHFKPSASKVTLSGLTIDVYDAVQDIYETSTYKNQKRNTQIIKTELCNLSNIGKYEKTNIYYNNKVLLLKYENNNERVLPDIDSNKDLNLDFTQLNHGIYFGEVPSWRMKPKKVIYQEFIRNKNVEVLKIGGFYPCSDNSLPSSKVITALTERKMHTPIRGNLTMILDENDDLNNKQVNFYLNQWGSYNENNELTYYYDRTNDYNMKDNSYTIYENTIESSPSCFKTGHLPLKTNFSQVNILNESIKAVKTYIASEMARRIKQPQGFLTYIDLTPYPDDENIVRWNTAGIAYFIYYIPKLNKNDSTYERIKQRYTNGDSNLIIDNVGFLCTPVQINQFDVYCDQLECGQKLSGSIVYMDGKKDKWYTGENKAKQFNMIADIRSLCYKKTISEVDYNDGSGIQQEEKIQLINIPEEPIEQNIDTAPYVYGKINYYDDNVAKMNGQLNPFDNDFVVSFAPITVNKESFQQYQSGFIRKAGTLVEVEKDDMDTGFKKEYGWMEHNENERGRYIDKPMTIPRDNDTNWSHIQAVTRHWYFAPN